MSTTPPSQLDNKSDKKEKEKEKETDNRKTVFFPVPLTKANSANKEDHERQLNVHGLSSEFLEASAGGVQDNELFQLHKKLETKKVGKHGFDFKPHHIIGARHAWNTSSNTQVLPMRVTYDSPQTKRKVIDAALCGGLWGCKNPHARAAFFRDIPMVGREDNRKENIKKQNRTPRCPKDQEGAWHQNEQLMWLTGTKMNRRGKKNSKNPPQKEHETKEGRTGGGSRERKSLQFPQ